MTNMIERVARAIYQGRNGYGCRAWGSLPKLHHAPYLADAKAAIEAMREPTEAMVNAAIAGLEGQQHCKIISMARESRASFYRAMITAALSQQEKN